MTARKPKPQVWLVEDRENAPGRILAVFYSERDAHDFAIALRIPCSVESRTLFYGQPPHRGYNQ